MAGFFRSLFWWNNMKQLETSVRPRNMNGPINLYRRTNLKNMYSLYESL